MQFKLVVVNSSNQSKPATVVLLWLVTKAKKLAIVNLPLPIWRDYHY